MDKTDLYEFPVYGRGGFRLTGAGKRVGSEPDYRHMTRTIDSWEIIVVERGVLYMREGRTRYELRPGGMLLLEPGKEHGGYRDHSVDFYWLHFTTPSVLKRPYDFLQVLMEKNAVRQGEGICIPKHHTLKTPYDLYTVLGAYLAAQKSDAVYREERLFNRFRDALFIIIDDVMTRVERREPVRNTQVHHVWRIMQFLGEHFTRDVTVEEVTARTGLNRDYANRIFKAANGCGIKEYHIRLRMEKARTLLENGNLPIARIAETVGYDDQYYFSRLFKQKNGMSPRAYRETMYKVRN